MYFVILCGRDKKGERTSFANHYIKTLWCQATVLHGKSHWLNQVFPFVLRICFPRVHRLVVRGKSCSVDNFSIWGFLGAHSMVGHWVMCWQRIQLHFGVTDCRFVKTLHASQIFKVGELFGGVLCGFFFLLSNYWLRVLGVSFEMSLYIPACAVLEP